MKAISVLIIMVVVAICLAASSRITMWNEERLLEEKVYG